ncbi:hypothetical protein GCM10009741_05860 [Kribbella lupini]|uniref:Ppx/GppA phosphatase N-terminal domain-containing protein n=1 Tax=Kribbella lupini TaxID=291602 RepID=A0ABN2A5D7_9ACTN
MLAFATSALREAPSEMSVFDRVRTESDVDLQVLSGQDEARLTFLAVRRWFGWSSGRSPSPDGRRADRGARPATRRAASTAGLIGLAAFRPTAGCWPSAPPRRVGSVAAVVV